VPDPTPEPSTPSSSNPSGWRPTGSTLAGTFFGGAVGQLVVAGAEYWVTHAPLKSSTAGAITMVAVGIIGYLFPDGGRK
jgi:hypothetical protein